MPNSPLFSAGTSQPSGAERRTSPRKRLEGELSLVDLGSENGGLMLDLSESGLAMQAIFPVAKQPEIPVVFELPLSGARIRAKAEVAWTTPGKQAGLRFTDIPDTARDQIRRWLSTEAHFTAAFAKTISDSTEVYSDIPNVLAGLGAGLEQAAAEKTIKYVPEFAKATPAESAATEAPVVAEESLQTISPAENLQAQAARSAVQTVRYVPEFAEKQAALKPASVEKPPATQAAAAQPFQPVWAPDVSGQGAHDETELENLPEVQPVEETVRVDPTATLVAKNAAAEVAELSSLVGKPLAAQLSEPVAAMWREPGFLERLRGMSPAGRRRMLQDLEFQARAFSRWLLEMEAAGGRRAAGPIETRRPATR